MKASVRLRENRRPLCRAKVPITILGLPFRAAIAGGDSKELSLSLATLFPTGPSIAAVYHPNDPRRPFSLLLKTGTGPYASPSSSSSSSSPPFSLALDFDPFDFLNPKFLLRFRPSLGHFSLTHSLPSPSSSFAENPLSSVGVAAVTELPILSSAVLSFRWKAGLPSGPEGIGVMEKLPVLVMEKVGMEHVAGKEEVGGGGVGFEGRRVLEIVERECRMLRRCVEGLVKERVEVGKRGEIEKGGVEGCVGVNEKLEIEKKLTE